jgi:plastocyanin
MLALIPLAAAVLVSAPADVVATDYAFSPPVTVNAGETVTFSYPTGISRHNVAFSTGTPTACAPALPERPVRAPWTSACRFDTPGEYDFVCDLHPQMTGRVTVLALPTPTPTADPQPQPQPQPQPTIDPSPSPAASQPLVERRQRGSSVRGSIMVAGAGSRLTVNVLAKRKRVGRTTRTVGAGKATFTVPMNAAARRTLRRARRLALTVRITVAPPSGAAFTATRSVTLRR